MVKRHSTPYEALPYINDMIEAETRIDLPHAAIGQRLKQARGKKFTQTDVANRLGVDQSTYAHWERGRGAPDFQQAEKLAGLYDVSVNWLIYGSDEVGGAPLTPESAPHLANEMGGPGPDASDRFRLPKDIKVLGTSECGPNGRFVMDHGDAIDYVRRPPGIASAKDVFCIHLQGDSMEPYFRAGELIYLSEKRPVQVGGLVVVELHPKNDGEPGPSMFKALVRRTAEYVELQQANPERRFKVPTKDVKKIYRVLTNAELWGV